MIRRRRLDAVLARWGTIFLASAITAILATELAHAGRSDGGPRVRRLARPRDPNAITSPTTWIVDGASSACRNTGTGAGTTAVPFCTIQTAANKALPGDTILVNPATYREQVTPKTGSVGSPITYRATAPGVLLLGTNDLSSPGGWTPASPTAWSQPFMFTAKQVFVDGVRLASAASLAAMTPNSFFYDAVPKVLYVDLGGPNPAVGHVVEASARTYGFNLVSVTDLVIDGFAMRGQNSMGVRALSSGSVIVRNIDTSHAATNGFRLEAATGPVTVERCMVSFAGSVGMLVVNTTGVTLSGNTSHHNGFHGISLQGSDYNLVIDNMAYANVKPFPRSAVGIDINAGSSHNVIQGNTVFANDDSGIEIYTGSNHNLVTRNISYLNGDHGFDLIMSDDTRLIGNTSYGNTHDGFSIEGSVTNTKLFNNIAMDNGVNADEFNLYVDELSLTGFESDSNIIWNSSPVTSIRYNNASYSSLVAYRSATGQEAHGIAADPMFRNPATGDFRLMPGSPAIDSADASAPGFTAPDHDGAMPADDQTVIDTGFGSPTYADRGALESDPQPIVFLSLIPGDGHIDVGGTLTADASASVDTGGSPIASYRFDFGDGTVVGPQSSAAAWHTFPTGGTFTLTVTVTDGAGGQTSVTRTITVTDDPPQPLLHVTPLSGLVDLFVTADASGTFDSDGTIADYTFDFGDGTIVGPQVSPVATHTYEHAGIYTIVMTAADTARNTASAISEVQVWDNPPVAVLSVTPTAGTVNLDVKADGSASSDTDGSPIVSYRFDFGDGVIVQQGDPIALHTYTRGGTFVVTMTVVDSEGLQASASAPVTVTDDPPVAVLSVTPSSGSINLTVLADASGSHDDDGSPIFSYTFDFGDGTVIGPQSGRTALHVYRTPGNFTVRLTVTDTNQLTSTATATVSATNGAPNASATATPSSGFLNMTVTVDASGSRDEDAAPIHDYVYDFGDGSPVVGPLTVPTALHVYRIAGVFTVHVTVTDTLGQSSIATAMVTVIDGPPVAALTVTPSSGSTGMMVTADASASTDNDATPIRDYIFDFGDGFVTAPRTTPSATHAYMLPGTFTVRVTVTDTGGHSTSATRQVVMVDDPPVARLSLPAQVPVGSTITANAGSSTDTGATPIASYRFDFGDGSPLVGPQPGATANHLYSRSGAYTVTVVVADTAGQTSSATGTITIFNTAPTAALSLPPSALMGASVTASASGSRDSDGAPIATYAFNFGDGTAVVGPQASSHADHVFTGPGTFTVTVTVTDTEGLSSTATASITIIGNNAPTAVLSVPSQTMAGSPITASASASTDTDAWPIATYRFNFGDGTAVVGPQASPSASHTFAGPGTFTVTVTVTDTGGLSSTASSTISVIGNTAPVAILNMLPSPTVERLTTTADASGSTDTDPWPIATYKFNFGDGTPIVGPQASPTAPHVYSRYGTYTVTLTVTDAGGKTSTTSRQIVVVRNSAPAAALTVSPNNQRFPVVVTANASASTDPDAAGIVSYTFEWRDGTPNTGPQASPIATHTYTKSGNFDVKVKVTDKLGAQSDKSFKVMVKK